MASGDQSGHDDSHDNRRDATSGHPRSTGVLYVGADDWYADRLATRLEREYDRLDVTVRYASDGTCDGLLLERYDCVVIEDRPGELDGADVVRSIRERSADVPVILYASDGCEALAGIDEPIGVTDCLQLPAEPERPDGLGYRVLSCAGATDGGFDHHHAHKKYRTLIETAPDPIFVANAATGVLVEANQAATELLQRPHEDVVGMHQSELHPEGDAAKYREMFERHVEEGGTFGTLPDGSPAYVETGDGSRVPVEISAEVVEVSGTTLVFGIFRDVSAKRQYEHGLATLHETSQGLHQATSADGVRQRIVESGFGLLDVAEIAIYTLDERDSELCRTACEARTDPPRTPSCVGADDEAWWEVFASDGPTVVDIDEERAHAGTTVALPITEQDVLVAIPAGSRLPGTSMELLEVLSRTAEAVLNRIARERELRSQQRQLASQHENLSRLKCVNAQIRGVMGGVVDATTGEELANVVCGHLSETDLFDFAWIGRYDHDTETLDPIGTSDDNHLYLDSLEFDVDASEDAEPACRAAATGEQVHVERLAELPSSHRWVRSALLSGFSAGISLPLEYDGVLTGVLTVYSVQGGAFDVLTRPVLTDMANVVAHGMVADARRHAVLTRDWQEAEFQTADDESVFLQLARHVGSSLEVVAVHPQPDESTRVDVRFGDAAASSVMAFVERSVRIASGDVLWSDDGSLVVQFRISGEFSATRLATQGVELTGLRATPDHLTLDVSVPPTTGIRWIAYVVGSLYPDAELAGKWQASPLDSERQDRLVEGLTEKQRAVIQAAFDGGYFNSPKDASGQQLASSMGISASSFHQHLREAERKILATLFAGDSHPE